MAKSLLILMLVTTQLLLGSGVSVYLCIGSDGSYSIDAGPESCTACRHSEQDIASGSCPHAETGSPCDRHEGGGAIREFTESLSIAQSCACTHIPVLVASESTTSFDRNAPAADYVRLPAFADQVVGVILDNRCSMQSAFSQANSLGVPDFALIVVSTVSIRC